MNINDTNLLRTGSYINGQWQTSEQTFDVIDPATLKVVGTVAEVTEQQLDYAVHSAKVAQVAWAAITAKERSKILQRWFLLIMENQHDLAIIMTLEQGKTLAESMGEIDYAATYIEWFSEEAKRIYGDITPHPSTDRRLITLQQPVGVVSAITPWNYPSGMITRKAAPALAAGCSFIVKPSELTPLSALALAELADRAGIPAGVFNVITGEDAETIGNVLTKHPDIRKFTFTGSTAVGKKLLEKCASTVKRTSLELGGNAPLIIFDDANLDVAIKGTMSSKFRNTGQTCVCANRIFVQRGIYEQFVNKLATEIKQLVVGNGLEETTNLGPLISANAIRKVERLVRDAENNGAKILLGGSVSEQGENFYQPTLITDVSSDMSLAKEEIFGPIVSVIPFDDEEQAVFMANDTPYGLAAYLFTSDMARSWRVSEALEYGMVGINEGILTSVQAPFGGVKESGLGREGSQYGIDEYLEKKYICMGNL